MIHRLSGQFVGCVQYQGHRVACPLQDPLTGRDGLDTRIRGIGPDILPTAATIALGFVAEDFQKDGPTEFRNRLRSPVLAMLLEVSKSIVGRVNQLMGPRG